MSFFTDDAVLEMPRGPHPWGWRFQRREELRSGLASRFAGHRRRLHGEDRHWGSKQDAIAAIEGTSVQQVPGTPEYVRFSIPAQCTHPNYHESDKPA
jgi:hypothetical protein